MHARQMTIQPWKVDGGEGWMGVRNFCKMQTNYLSDYANHHMHIHFIVMIAPLTLLLLFVSSFVCLQQIVLF